MTCGLGCGKPHFRDGYCKGCWIREDFRVGGVIPILPNEVDQSAIKADDIPDTFPKDWL